MGKWNSPGSVKISRLCIELKLPGLKLRINFLLFPTAILLAAAGYLDKYLLLFASIALHEASHVIFALIAGAKPGTVSLSPTGVSVGADNDPDDLFYRLPVLISGPAANLMLYGLLSVFAKCFDPVSDNMRFFIAANLAFGIFNLLPVLPMDGGRVIYRLIAVKGGFLSAGRWACRLSAAMTVIILTAGIAQFALTGFNFSLICIGLYMLFTSNAVKSEAAFMNIRHIIYRHERFLKKGIYPARDLAVLKSAQVGESIKNMDYDRFHIIYVLDDDLRITGILTEKQIMDGLLESEPGITFEVFLKRMRDKGEKVHMELPPPVI